MSSCKHCQKKFTSTSARNRHMRDIHKDLSENKVHSSRIQCPLCHNNIVTFKSFNFFGDHLKESHDITLNQVLKKFETAKEFFEWKEKEEKETISFYQKHTRSESTNGTVVYYECNRSDLSQFKSKCTSNTRKIRGSIKLAGVCPSRIRAEFFSLTSEVHVNYVNTHVGHDFVLKCQPLSKTEENIIVDKIRKGVTYNRILQEARTIDSKNIARLNLLSKKDIRNLAAKHKLGSKRHKSDIMSVEMRVAEWNAHQQNVFIFKKPGDTQHPLEDKDFVLAFMNQEMQHMLQTNGTHIIGIVDTDRTNPYTFELTTILVLDDKNVGHPAAILISNRNDRIVQEFFLSELKKLTGPIIPNYIMTDDSSIYWESWNTVMGTVVNKLLYTWHVKENWLLQGKNKIKNKAIQETVQNYLNHMLKASEENEFIRIKNDLIYFLNTHKEAKFLEYLNKYYLQNSECIKSWAHCYRMHVGINTNMHLEALHKNLKDKYFNGKSFQSLETCLDAIDQLITDKSWERIASVSRPTATDQDLMINKAHKVADNQITTVNMVAEVDATAYLVHSASTINSYEVRVIDNQCNCRLRCIAGSYCAHKFSCTCYESSIKNQICKHIHLVILHLKQKNVSQATENELIRSENVKEEIDVTLHTLQKEETYTDEATTNIAAQNCESLFRTALKNCEKITDFTELERVLKEFNKYIEESIPKPGRTRKLETV